MRGLAERRGGGLDASKDAIAAVGPAVDPAGGVQCLQPQCDGQEQLQRLPLRQRLPARGQSRSATRHVTLMVGWILALFWGFCRILLHIARVLQNFVETEKNKNIKLVGPF